MLKDSSKHTSLFREILCLSCIPYSFFFFPQNFPSGFAKRYLTKRSSELVILYVNGKTWSVNFHYEKTIARLTAGWRGFVRGYNLEVGSACVFVLSNEDRYLQCYLLRHTQKLQISRCPLQLQVSNLLVCELFVPVVYVH